MASLKEAADEFLTHKRIAVAGVSRKGDVAANVIYKKLRASGYQVFPVNPNADRVEGDECYPSLAAIPGGVEGVVIAAPPAATMGLVRDCGTLGIKRVWMHRSFGQGSLDQDAVRLCNELGISVIPGSCPMMFLAPVDVAHACMRWVIRITGKQAAPEGYA